MLRRKNFVLTLLAGFFVAVCAVPLVNAAGTAPKAGSQAFAPTTGGTKKMSGKSSQTKQKVVLQVSDDNPKTWNQALNVIENLQAGVIEIISRQKQGWSVIRP